MNITQARMYFVIIPVLLLGMSAAHSDDDHDPESFSAQRLAPVSHALYKEECGSCHMAYPPGLLPAGSWQKIMATLSNHFGDNAELTPVKQNEITQYLQNNSANKGKSRRIADSHELRITQQASFQHHHREIPARLSTANPAVKSLSNCAACHQRAEQGSFREREISIPGYGRWEN